MPRHQSPNRIPGNRVATFALAAIACLLATTFGAEIAAAQGKVGYRGEGRYYKPKVKTPTQARAESAQSRGRVIRPSSRSTGHYGSPPTRYRTGAGAGRGYAQPYPHVSLVNPYGATTYGGTSYGYSHGSQHHYGSSHHGYTPYYYTPIYVPGEPTVYGDDRYEDPPPAAEPYYPPPQPQPVVVVVQAPASAPAAPSPPPAPKPLTHPTTPEPAREETRGPGKIDLLVEPADAVVHFDGRRLGTAAEIAELGGQLEVSSGVHVLEVTHPDYKAERMVFGVKAGGGVRVEVDLEGRRLTRRSDLQTTGSEPPKVRFGG